MTDIKYNDKTGEVRVNGEKVTCIRIERDSTGDTKVVLYNGNPNDENGKCKKLVEFDSVMEYAITCL